MGLDNHRGIENVSLVGDQVGLRANGIVKLLNMAEKKNWKLFSRILARKVGFSNGVENW